MGRKIPGRKHHGVRDPEKQAAARYNRIKDKINVPPTNPDEQEVPKSLQRIIDLKNKTKSGAFSLKKKKKAKSAKNKFDGDINKSNQNEKIKKFKGKPEKHIPEFKQLPAETNKVFLSRITRLCQNVAKEVAFEEKYGVEIRKNEAGEVEGVVKRPMDELELLIKQARKEKKEKKEKKKKKAMQKDDTPKLTKSQKWQLKKKEKKMKKSSKVNEFEKYQDQVKFGEIVHAPPTLVAPKKVEKSQNAPRPGKKNLLLKSIIDKENASSRRPPIKNGDVLHKTLHKGIDKKGKRRDLPNSLRRQLEMQQKEIISAYKSLKANKYS